MPALRYILRRQRRADTYALYVRMGKGETRRGNNENPKNKGHYKRFKCGETGDVLHFIGKEFGLSGFKDILNKGIAVDESNYKKQDTMRKASKSRRETNDGQTKTSQELSKKDKDYTDFFNETHKRIKETDYLTKRGISQETQKRFKIGFVKEWKPPDNNNTPPSQHIIIPLQSIVI
jgi:DNA primase